jgi:hypothetical protein
MNVSFEYLYRDGANYKNWGEVVFKSISGLDLNELERQIVDGLIDGQNFIAERVAVPTLYFSNHDASVDHSWHEFVGMSWTNKSPTQSNSIEQFIARLTH